MRELWKKVVQWWHDRGEIWLAWILLVGSTINWPLSQLTYAKDEFPVTLGLSWLAIMLTALDYLKNARAHRDIQSSGEEEE